MKKVLLTLFIVTLATASFAQLSGGLKAGVNFVTQKYKASSLSVNATGTSFHIGAFAQFSLSDAITLQPELLYNMLKVDFEGDDITSNYLSIPVMFAYGFADNKFNVQAGPQLGLLLSTDPSEYKDQDGFTGTDFGFNLGAGANFNKLSVTARYCIGIADITGDALKDSGLDKITNNVFQLSVGYKLFGE